MIWRRHWLELRIPVLVAIAGALFLAWRYSIALNTGALTVNAGGTPNGFRWYEALLPVTGPEWMLAWGTHVLYCVTLAMYLPFVLAGTGLREQSFSTGLWGAAAPPSRTVVFTLSLPISRFGVIWTRLASAGVACLIVFAVSLTTHVAVLIGLGHAVPFWPMAAASFAGALIALAGVSVASFVLSLTPYLLPVLIVPFLFTGYVGRRVMLAAADGGINVGLVVLVACVIAVVLFLSTKWAASQEV